MPILAVLFFLQTAFAAHVTTGFYKSLLDVQDKNGKEEKTPLDPAIGIGLNWQLSTEWGFSPQINYIHSTRSSKDGYNDYKTHTFSLLYDFVWLPFDSLRSQTAFAFRMGLGTFIRRIKGEGGTVIVPNGATGSSTAYRPDETRTSYSATVNLGADLALGILKDYFDNFGLRFETYTFRALSKEYRSHAYTLSCVGYF